MHEAFLLVSSSKSLDVLQPDRADHPPNKADSSGQAKTAALLFSLRLAGANTRRRVSARGSLLIRTHQISQTAETSPSYPPQTLARVLLHPVLTGLPEPFSCSLSSTGALCRDRRAPWRNSTILFQSGPKGTTKVPSSAAQTETQHQLGSFRGQGREHREVVESTPTLRSLMLASLKRPGPWITDSTTTLSPVMLATDY